MRKNLLVTGGAGFIGSHFVHLAAQLGYRVVVLDLLTYAGRRENLDQLLTSGQVELVVGNICDGRLVLRLLQEHEIDAILNFAAESHVDRSISGPAPFIETNVVGTFRLLEAASEYRKTRNSKAQDSFRYLQISTDEVFGSLGPQGKFSESTPFAPNSPYSASKAAGDHLVRSWHRTYGLPTLITHSTNNYGPRQHPEKLIPLMISCALSEEPLPVYGDGKNVRDWMHATDNCRGILLTLEKGKPGQSYGLGGNSERSNLQVVKMICQEMDRQQPRTGGKKYESLISFVRDRLGHDFRYALDDTLARNTLGFRCDYSFEKGLAETVTWYLEHPVWRPNTVPVRS